MKIENNIDRKKLYDEFLKSPSAIDTPRFNESLDIKASIEHAQIAREHADLDLLFRKQDQDAKNFWELFIRWGLVISIGFYFLIVVSIGKNWLNFEKYPNSVNYLFSTLTALISLAVIVVRHRFSNKTPP